MKSLIKISLLVLTTFLLACEKTNTAPQSQSIKSAEENCGPYGKVSNWKSIGGDTLFSETLTLTYYRTEAGSPCNTCYYMQNISFWNCYDYTFSVSECIVPTDTLIFTDIDSQRKAIFKREK